TAPILGCGREPRTTEFAPPPPGGFFLRIDWAGCIIVTFGLPDPDQLFVHPYICMPNVPRSSPKENLHASQSNTYLSPGSLFNPRHKRNRSIFYADEILARHTGKHSASTFVPSMKTSELWRLCRKPSAESFRTT